MNYFDKKLIFVLTLFISGFCGISYEILYSRMLGNIIGNSFVLNASILIMFLLGIGIGTKIAHKFTGFLWLIESLIGIYAILFTFINPYLDNLFFEVLPQGNIIFTILGCSVLLFLPTILIGTSLPLFAGLFKSISSGKIFDLSYMIYNFGAGLTAFSIEFFLIRTFGTNQTVLIISCLNLITGALLFLFFRKTKIEIEEEENFIYQKDIVIPLILLSIASSIFQLLILKISEFIFGPFNETFAMVISIVLFGIAIGSLLCRLFNFTFKFYLLSNIIFLTLILGLFSNILFLYSNLYTFF